MAQLCASYPFTVPIQAVNRQCASGLQVCFRACAILQACAQIASAIRAGFIDCGVGAGVESMSLGTQDPPQVDWAAVGHCPMAADCAIPMGQTSEIVAERYHVSRCVRPRSPCFSEEQDAFAAESQRKAAQAQREGRFQAELVPVTVPGPDGGEVVVDADEGIRGDTTAERLAKLAPSFKEGGTTTAGNASQVSDGAAAVLMMRRSEAERLNVPILGASRAAHHFRRRLPQLCGSGRAARRDGRWARGCHSRGRASCRGVAG
jgi:acetyl-CoA acyltransferase 1